MKVYRCVSEEELKLYVNKDCANLGGTFSSDNSNTFKYKENVKYIHFFKKIEDCRYAYEYYTSKKKLTKYFIAAFDIPFAELAMTHGYGYYNQLGVDKMSGYEAYLVIEKRHEYAIPAQHFKSEWFIGSMPYETFIEKLEQNKNKINEF